MDDLPCTLDSDCAYYSAVAQTAKMYIKNVDNEFQRLGAKNIKKSADAKASKRNLYRLYKALQVKDNWDKPRPTYWDFKK